MKTKAAPGKKGTPPAAATRPLYDDRALVFAIRDPDCVQRAVSAVRARRSRPTEEPRGLDLVLEYVMATKGAALRPVFPDRARRVHHGAGWKLARPAAGEELDLSGIHFLRLPSASDRARLEDALARDTRIAYVHRPALPPARLPEVVDEEDAIHGMKVHADGGPDDFWWRNRCGFRDALTALKDRIQPAGPIALIDTGDVLHPDLKARLKKFVEPPTRPSRATHAAEVASVIAVVRDLTDPEDPPGCCPADLHLYNVFNDQGGDYEAYLQALGEVADSDARVVNVSLTFDATDTSVDLAIQRCLRNRKIIVAAMGDKAPPGHPENSPLAYPAASPGVIAVGGTNRQDRRTDNSSVGDHMWISAPGEDILTVFADETDFRPQSGTSYAAPLVAAAIWLALSVRPEWGLDEIKCLLARSVHGDGQRTPELGHGRLDVLKMIEELERADPCAPV